MCKTIMGQVISQGEACATVEHTHTDASTCSLALLCPPQLCIGYIVNLKELSLQQRIFPKIVLKSCERSNGRFLCVNVCGNSKWFTYETRQFVGVALVKRLPRQLLGRPLYGEVEYFQLIRRRRTTRQISCDSRKWLTRCLVLPFAIDNCQWQ